jgi:hypothetical protein
MTLALKDYRRTPRALESIAHETQWMRQSDREIRRAVETGHHSGNGYQRARSAGLCSWSLAMILALLVSASLVAPPEGHAQNSFPEYQIKAAYLFNFLKFVEWPDDPSTDLHVPWVIGIVGEARIGVKLTELAARESIQGHELRVRLFQPSEDLRVCHILFIGASENKRLPSILMALDGTSVLTVADMKNFTESGGMIQLMMKDDEMRFVVDLRATSRARLKVSSKLLAIAHTVRGAQRIAAN